MDEGTDSRADDIQELSDEESQSVTGGCITRESVTREISIGFSCPFCGTYQTVDVPTLRELRAMRCQSCGRPINMERFVDT